MRRSKTWHIHDFRYKILVLGESGSGKSSIIRRIAQKEFSEYKHVIIK